MADLTPKQRLFVAEYIIDFNASRAARAAGYSLKTAGRIGQENLQKPVITAAIEEAIEERLRQVGVTKSRILEELASLGFSNMADYIEVDQAGRAAVDLTELTRAQTAAIQEITSEAVGGGAARVIRTKFKLADKKPSLELLGKHLKLFTEKHEHSGPAGGPVQVIEVISSGDGNNSGDAPAED